jgi:predicted O-methyltransferase YrrM
MRFLTSIALLRRDPAGVRFLVPFLRSRNPDHSPLDDGLPWLSFKAIRWLAANLYPTMHVFEYGSGGSTLFFARRVADVVSVEHDADWHARTSAVLADEGVRNCTYLLRPPVPQADVRYRSTDSAYVGFDFADYVTAIEEYADRSFDLVSVDGRARPSCVAAAVSKVRRGGWILLDNSDRPAYREAYELLAPFPRLDLRGIAPYTNDVTQTTVWRIDTDPRHDG